MNNFEKVCEDTSNLRSPVEDNEGNLYLVTENGAIKRVREGQPSKHFQIEGQLSGVALDKTGKTFFLTDLAHCALISKYGDDEKKSEIYPMLKDYDGVSLVGPNSVVISNVLNCLYFTDSGPFGETSLDNPKGSLFVIDLEQMNIRPLALNSLAYPSGLALSTNEKNVYVCETCTNRILRFTLTPQGGYLSSVFYQFSGRFGPTAIAVSQSDTIYVARYEHAFNSSDGIISVINKQGQFVSDITVPYAPEITGLGFSKFKPNILYITENSQTPQCIRMFVDKEENPSDKSKSEINISKG